MELLDDRRVKVARPLIPWVAGVGGGGRREEGEGGAEWRGKRMGILMMGLFAALFLLSRGNGNGMDEVLDRRSC
jgi:hypothetical protein